MASGSRGGVEIVPDAETLLPRPRPFTALTLSLVSAGELRYTLLVQVHPDGISTLENLSTHEQSR